MPAPFHRNPTQPNTMILVTGSTGKVGQHVLDSLQTTKTPFQALARSDASAKALTAKGVRVVRGDVSDEAAWRAALKGVEAVFLLTSGADPYAEEAKALATAKAAGVRRIVKLAAIGSRADAANSFQRGHARIEQWLEQSGLQWTSLRPNYFMQNWVAYNAPAIKAGQPVYANAGTAQFAWIDTRDIGAAAAAVLTQPGHDGRIYELTGPESLSYGQVTERIGKLLGRKVDYVAVPDQAAYQAMLGMGMPADYAWGLTTLNQGARSGNAGTVLQTVELLTGKPSRTLDQFLHENLAAFRG
jgi:uncharacterized protein YbjT (DUF2867 family)